MQQNLSSCSLKATSCTNPESALIELDILHSADGSLVWYPQSCIDPGVFQTLQFLGLAGSLANFEARHNILWTRRRAPYRLSVS